MAKITTGTSVPFWGNQPDSWDTLILGGKKLPGRIQISGTGFEMRVDKKKVAGQDGVVVSKLGREPAKFDIIIELWDATHLRDYQAVVAQFSPKAPSLPKPPKLSKPGAAGADFEPTLVKIRAEATAAYEAKLRKAKQRPGIRPIDIAHPSLALYGIKSVHVMSASLPKTSKPGIYEITLKCEEFIKQRDVGVNTPDSAAGLGSPGNSGSAVNRTAFNLMDLAKEDKSLAPSAKNGAP